MKEQVEEILSLGLNVVPLNNDKTPKRKWSRYITETYNDDIGDDFEAVGIVCGRISNGLEVVDIDSKYDDQGTLISRYKKLINYQKEGLWDRFTISQTRSGGLHLLYYTDVEEGNMKLASRDANAEEKSKGDSTTKVLIETRGSGGYIVGVPSKGYKFIQGDYSTIPKLSNDERDIVISSARALTRETMEVFRPSVPSWRSKGKTPWEDFNERGDTIELLTNAGWTIQKESGKRVFLKRPGNTEQKYSGNYHKELRTFTCFSSSQSDFEPQRAYPPSSVFAILMCGGDFSESARQLLALGYGQVPEKELQNDIEVYTDEFQLTDYISDRKYDDEMIYKYRNDLLKLGYESGYEELDNHWRFKEGKFVIGLGHDNVGKSTVIWYIAVLQNLMNGIKTIIYSTENEPWVIKMKMCEFALGKNSKMWNDMEADAVSTWFDENFEILYDEDPLAYNQILQVAEYLIGKGGYKMLIIDPYNTLAYNWEGLDRRLGMHDYHHHVASTFKRWASKNNCTIFLNTHAVTEARRLTWKTGDFKDLVRPPLKSHAEGGGKWAAKADDFLILHRYNNDPRYRTRTEIHVTKVKEEWSGGMPTMKDNPVYLYLKKPSNFFGFYDDNNYNPIEGLFRRKYGLGREESFSFNDRDTESDFMSNRTLQRSGFDSLNSDDEVPF